MQASTFAKGRYRPGAARRPAAGECSRRRSTWPHRGRDRLLRPPVAAEGDAHALCPAMSCASHKSAVPRRAWGCRAYLVTSKWGIRTPERPRLLRVWRHGRDRDHYRDGCAVDMRAIPGNPYDGHTQRGALEKVEILTAPLPRLCRSRLPLLWRQRHGRLRRWPAPRDTSGAPARAETLQRHRTRQSHQDDRRPSRTIYAPGHSWRRPPRRALRVRPRHPSDPCRPEGSCGQKPGAPPERLRGCRGSDARRKVPDRTRNLMRGANGADVEWTRPSPGEIRGSPASSAPSQT